MTLDEFRQSLTANEPPAGLTLAAGLWWDAKGDWTRAHESAQQEEGGDGSWVLAYPVLVQHNRIISVQRNSINTAQRNQIMETHSLKETGHGHTA